MDDWFTVIAFSQTLYFTYTCLASVTPSSKIMTCSWHLAGFWEPGLSCPSLMKGSGELGSVSTWCVMLSSSPMKDCTFLNGDGGRVFLLNSPGAHVFAVWQSHPSVRKEHQVTTKPCDPFFLFLLFLFSFSHPPFFFSFLSCFLIPWIEIWASCWAPNVAGSFGLPAPKAWHRDLILIMNARPQVRLVSL